MPTPITVALIYPAGQLAFARDWGERFIALSSNLLLRFYEAEESVRHNATIVAECAVLCVSDQPKSLFIPTALAPLLVAERLFVVARTGVQLDPWPIDFFVDDQFETLDSASSDLISSIETISRQARQRTENDKLWAIRNNVLVEHPDGSVAFNPLLLRATGDLEFSTRTSGALRNENIVYIGDLVQRTEAEMLRVPNFGRKSLNEVKEILSTIGLRLGLDVPGWPPEVFEEELQRSDLAHRISQLRQEPLGATFQVTEEHFRIDPSGSQSDRLASENSIVQQLHEDVKRKTTQFSGVAPRLDNQLGWSGISALTARLSDLISRPTLEIPDVIGHVYSSALELASFLEMDNSVSSGSSSFAVPLDPEIRRPMEDLVRTLAPWLRIFPSIRQLDDEMGKFLVQDVRIEPAMQAVSEAQKASIILAEDAESLAGLLQADRAGGNQGHKAGSRGFLSTKNLILVAATVVSPFIVGSVASDFSTKSVIVQRAGTFLASSEGSILQMLETLPGDLKLAIELLFKELRGRPGVIPNSPRPVRVPGQEET